MINQHLT